MSSPSISPERILEKAMESEMISVEQLHLLLHAALPQVVLLDVRTPVEHQQGVIAGSRLFPCDHDLENLENTSIFRKDFNAKFRPERFDPAWQYILICRTGPRTAIALETFLQHGYTACELLGGVTEWRQKGLALQAADPAAVIA